MTELEDFVQIASKELQEYGYIFATPEWVQSTVNKLIQHESVSLGAGKMLQLMYADFKGE